MHFSKSSYFLLFFILIFFSNTSYSQIKISEQVNKAQVEKKKVKTQTQQNGKAIVDKSYLGKMSLAKQTIKVQLEKTEDKSERNELIKKLHQIDNTYYNPSVRTELIRKSRPGYASRAEAYRTLTPKQRQAELIKAEMKRIEIQPDIRGTVESRWDNIQAWEKQFHCTESVKECFAGSQLKCRFVLDRCYEYVNRETFKRVRARFAAPR